MVKINVESFTDDELLKKYMALERKEDFDVRCSFCRLPILLHKIACTRRDKVNAFEHDKVNEQWELYGEKMRNIRKWKADQDEKERTKTEIMNGQKEMLQEFIKAQEKLVGAFKRKWKQNDKDSENGKGTFVDETHDSGKVQQSIGSVDETE